MGMGIPVVPPNTGIPVVPPNTGDPGVPGPFSPATSCDGAGSARGMLKVGMVNSSSLAASN